MKLIISIDRQAMSWAVFDEFFGLLKPFQTYSNESVAIKKAQEWCLTTMKCDETEVVYPRIQKAVLRS